MRYSGRSQPWQVKGPDNLKIFPLEALSNGAVRVVIIHKNSTAAAGVVLNVAGNYGDAIVQRLVAKGSDPLSARAGISLNGLTYRDRGGQAQQARASLAGTHHIAPLPAPPTGCSCGAACRACRRKCRR